MLHIQVVFASPVYYEILDLITKLGIWLNLALQHLSDVSVFRVIDGNIWCSRSTLHIRFNLNVGLVIATSSWSLSRRSRIINVNGT